MLAAKYNALGLVVTGTLLGRVIADVPAVLVGKLAAPRSPSRWFAWLPRRCLRCSAWAWCLASTRSRDLSRMNVPPVERKVGCCHML
jgi:hypothetical protein